MKSHGRLVHGFVNSQVFVGFLLLFVVALHTQTAPVQQSLVRRVQSPVAMSALPSGTIAVLESQGRLLLLTPDSGYLTVLKETLGYYTPIDLAAARLGDEETLFVTMSWSRATAHSEFNPGLLIRYSLQGKELRTWRLGTKALGGIAVDTQARMAYLGDLRVPQILRLRIGPDGKDEPEFLTNVPGAALLGALALDMGMQKLFAADAAQGAIYVVDLVSKKSRKLVSTLGEPAALAYDSVDHKLYVADASRRCIWVVAADEMAPKPRVFSHAKELREPRGLAFDRGGTLWVADSYANALFAFTRTGQITRTIRRQ